MKKNIYTSFFIWVLLISACSGTDKKAEKNSEKTAPQKELSEVSSTSMGSLSLDSNLTESIVEVVTNESGEEVPVITNKEGEKVIVSENGLETKVNPESIQHTTVTVAKKTSSNNSTKEEQTLDFNIHEYKKLDAFLGKYVSTGGNVRYASIKANRNELDAIIAEFKQTDVTSSWSKNEQLAFWINAYNIFTIKLIVDNYPTTSITKIAAKPWEKKIVTIGTKTYSLDYVENGIIRKQFNEPRIHFALNCASESCPILLNKAYKESNLNSLLTSQTKKFLNDTSKNSFSKKEAKISKIFDWYKADFPDVMGFIKKYHSMDYTPKTIAYMEYSWELNN